MDEKSEGRRRGGSLVVPVILILFGVLLLLDSLNIIPGIDWMTLFKFWPVILIAIGVEIILGRRVSCAGIFLLVIVIIIGAALTWWSFVDEGDRTTELVTFPLSGVERAALELDTGFGKLGVAGAGDMSQLLVGELDVPEGGGVDSGVDAQGDVAEVWLRTKRDFRAWPQALISQGGEWDVRLNDRVGWDMNVHAGIGDARLDLSELRVDELIVDWGIGSVEVVLPEQGATDVRIDGGLGDLTVEIAPGMPARFKVDRGISDLKVSDRFKRHGDYYETDDFDRQESYVYMEIDMGIGSVTVR
jgi:hypothetical protein